MGDINENTLPEGWREVCLGDVCDICYGKDHKKLKEGIVPCFGSGGIMRYVEKSIYSKESVLIPRKGSLSNLYYTDIPFWTVDTLFYTKIDEENIIPKFLYFMLKTKRLEDLNVGSAVPSLTTKVLNDLSLILPPINEQKKIANILSSFDNKIELLEEQNKTLEEIAQTIFKEWFKIDNSSKWHNSYLGDVSNITSSKRIFHKDYVYEGVPFYRSKEIIELSTKSSISTELFISEEKYNEIKNKYPIPQKGDVLLTSVGTIGIAYQVRDNSKFYFKDGNLIWLKDFSNEISADFVYYWLKQKSTQNLLNTISIGSTQRALTIHSVKELTIPIYNNEYKRRILYTFLKVNLNKINSNFSQIQSLKSLRDTLVPKLMNGSIKL